MNFKNSELYINKSQSIKFDAGKFDNYCVYITNFIENKPIKKFAPKDNEYFEDLIILKKIYGKKVYNFFVKIFEKTKKELNLKLAQSICDTCDKYFLKENNLCKKTFLILYYAMVAEENKTNTKLGKKIKRLGVHQILIENMKPEIAANFSKGMKWQEINNECEIRGF